MGVQAVLGIEFAKKNSKVKAAAVVVGTPLLTGPGAMTTVVILSQKYGYWPPAIASVLVLLITWFMLAYADKLHKIIGDRIVEILSRVLGLLLVAIAAEMIKNGVIQMINDFKLM
jgi:multiple antibiotic resistance protein